MQPRMTHICLHVDNLDDCIDFYQSYCRLKIVEDLTSEGKGSVYIAEPNAQPRLIIQLMLGGKPLEIDPQSERHFGFEVDTREDVDRIADKANQEGILLFEADEYAPGVYLCTVKDPNGNPVEFSFNHYLPNR